MESAFSFGCRGKVGFGAIIKQAGARGKYRIKREAGGLQSDSSKKSDIEVRARSGPEMLGSEIQSLYRIESAKRTPRISLEF